jgi:hypothetical protein
MDLVFMKSTGYSCQIATKRKFSQQGSKSIEIPNFMKIRPVEAGLFHAVGQT